jgi:threonine dehydrogenase-like Zn-dependent dehydrogenase
MKAEATSTRSAIACASSPGSRADTVASAGPAVQPLRGRPFFATPPVDGAFADFVTIHEDFAFALPDGMSDDVGALMEPLCRFGRGSGSVPAASRGQPCDHDASFRR